MGDEGGIGVLASILGGIAEGAGAVARGARAAQPFIRKGFTESIRFADPRRLAPLVQKIQEGPLFRPIPILEKVVQKTPVIKNLPEWARGAIGINTSPAGITGNIAVGYLLNQAIEKVLDATATQPAAAAPPQQTFASTTAAAPLSGPRVDASTTQMIDIGAFAPQQAPRLTPVTPTAPSTPVIGQTAYTAAQTGFRAPTDIPLSEFYGAQKAIGQYAEQGGELQRRLKEAGGAAGMSDAALMEWVQANPALAYRELVRREKRSAPSVD